MESFQIIPGKGYRPDNLTLYAWIGALENAPNEQFNQPGLFQNPEFFRSLWNTVKLSVIGSLVTAVFGQFFPSTPQLPGAVLHVDHGEYDMPAVTMTLWAAAALK